MNPTLELANSAMVSNLSNKLMALQPKDKLDLSMKPRNAEESLVLLKACCLARRVGNYYDTLAPRCEEDCLKSNHVSLYAMKHEGKEGEVCARMFLTQALISLSKAFNRSLGMSAEQVELTIDLIMEDPLLPNLKLDDVKLCFRRAMCGEYGQTYSIDPNVVLTWLKRYFSGRVLAAERVTLQEHNEEMSKPINRNASWRKAVDDLAAHLDARKLKR